MNNKTDPADSNLSETMAARIEIEELGDPAHQKKITDAVEALDGVQAIQSAGTTIKAAATDTEGAHPDLPTPNAQQAPVENADPGEDS
ncbi:MAG: hypothetical protein DMF48_00450 [Verrucomicrobia bacterium]|nr:MAG: hypothetical protein DMF48_00450 [Verrucomicrobiota bacterium]